MALFDGLRRRVTERAVELADEVRGGVEAACESFSDVRVRRDGDTLVIEAMGLLRRWLSDVRLRFAWWGSR